MKTGRNSQGMLSLKQDWEQKTLFALLLASGVAGLPAVAEAKSCATLHQIEGKECSNLTYKVDLSACADKTLKEPAQVKCDGGKATVSFKTASESYVAVVESKEAGWGKRVWSVGEVTATAKKDARATASVAEKKADVKPAAPGVTMKLVPQTPVIGPNMGATAPKAVTPKANDARSNEGSDLQAKLAAARAADFGVKVAQRAPAQASAATQESNQPEQQAVAQPAVSQPTQPAATQPAPAQAAVPQPPVAQPAVAQPAVAQPAQPVAATEPVAELAAATVTPSSAAVPQPAAAEFEVSGYLDMYYQTNLNKQLATGGRLFGAKNGVMQVNSAEVTLKRKKGQVAMRADIGAGETVDALAPNSTVTAAGSGSGPDVTATASVDPSRYFLQAYVSWSPAAVSGLTINAGKMYTHMGYEVTRAKDNMNYTRGYIFNYGIPLWHEGVSVNYAVVPDALTANLYAYNGWDGRLMAESNRSFTLGGNLTFTGVKGLTLGYSYIGGPETGDPRALREVHEILGTYVINDTFTVGFDAILGRQLEAVNGDIARWSAWALYGKAALTEKLALVARYENYDDSDRGFSVRGAFVGESDRLKIQSITGGLNYDLGDGLETRFEVRNDSADKESALFMNADGAPARDETAFTFSILYSL